MSETDFLKLKKHDNVETNTEKFDIENYLNGNWDKINKNAKEVNTKISNINSNNTELEKELKEIQDDFYQNSIRGQASGEYIHVEDSSNCRAKIGIGGNQEHETRSGKNLLELMEGTYSNNGITAVVKNGIVTLNGKATAISFVGINLLKSIELTNDKAYHLSAFNEKTAGDGTNYCSLRINQDNIQVLFNKTNANGSITTNLKISYITIRTQTGITYNNFVVKPQLEIGNGTDTWEQGGISPSPDYLSPIVAVGSNVNLFDKSTTTDGKYIGSNGSIQINNTAMYSDYIEIEVNEDYYISGRTIWGSMMLYNENKTFLEKISTAQPNGTFYVTNSSCKYIRVNASIVDKDTLKIEKGTVVTPYSSYGLGSVKVTKCNKNISKLLGKDSYWQYTSRGIKNMGRNNGTRILELELKKGQKVTIGLKLFSKPIKSTTFTIYLNGETNSQFLNINEYALNQIYKKEYTVTEDSLIEIRNWGNENSETYEFQLWAEIGSLTDYIQHEEQSYIMPVQSEMLEGDYFDFDNEEEVHVWGNVIVNETETINKNSNSEFFSITKSMSQFDTSATGIEQSISNYGTGTTLALGSGNTNNKYSFNASTIYLDCYNSNINTVEKLKVQLTKNNMKIYAKLATPTRLPFTDEQKAVAKELNNARTYKNVTNITTDSIAILDLDYAKDLEELTEYSTEERVIGRWIDGKPLYSKVGSIKFTSVYDSSGLHTRGSLIDSDIDYGTVSKVLNKNLLSSSLFNTYGTSTSNVYVENRQGNSNKGYILGFTDRTDLLNTTIYVVVEYTKTTD